MQSITTKEFLEHFEDDNFFEMYGEPVIVEEDNKNKLVCMSKEMYQQIRSTYEQDR